MLCDPSLWQHLMPLYSVEANQIFDVAEPGGWGNLDIFPGGKMEGSPIFLAAVMPFGMIPRALVITTASERGRPLCSCAPNSGALGIAGRKQHSNSCSDLELHDGAGQLWGTLAPSGSDYAVYLRRTGREHAVQKPTFRIEGDHQSGTLHVKNSDGEEIIAHAGIDDNGAQLDVGVAPQTDPILMLLLIVAVLVFNPADKPLTTPRISQMSCLDG